MKRRRAVVAGGVVAGGLTASSMLSGAVADAAASGLQPHTGTVTVTVDSDAGTAARSGAGSTQYPGSETLADAIAYTNANGGGTIMFASGLSGDTITLTAALPEITEPVTIDGPGASNLTIDGGGSSEDLGTMFSLTSVTGTTTFSGVTLTGGYAPGTSGGVIDDSQSPLVVRDSVISGSLSNVSNGGGIYERGSSLTITDSTFSNDSAHAGGGAIDLTGGPLVVEDSTFSGDDANQGGGIYAYVHHATISGSTFNDNSAPGANGGGAAAIDGYRSAGQTVTVQDSTITGNTAGEFGGGLNVGWAALTVTGSTIVGNSATDFGGGLNVGFFNPYGTATIQDSIIAGNSASDGPDIDQQNSGPVSAAFSLIGDGSDDSITSLGHNIIGTSTSPVDPKLGPLQNNGGPTETMLPALDSPALDAGSAFGLTTDQRGDPRTVDLSLPNPAGGDGTDIGAAELQPSELPDRSVIGTLGNRRVTWTLPSTLLCPKPSARLAVGFSSVPAAGSSSAKLRFKEAELTIGCGVKHVRIVTKRVHGHRKRVKVVSYLPNATVHGMSGSAKLKLSGLAAGSHALKLTFVFTETEHRRVHHRTVKVVRTLTKSLSTRVTSC